MGLITSFCENFVGSVSSYTLREEVTNQMLACAQNTLLEIDLLRESGCLYEHRLPGDSVKKCSPLVDLLKLLQRA